MVVIQDVTVLEPKYEGAKNMRAHNDLSHKTTVHPIAIKTGRDHASTTPKPYQIQPRAIHDPLHNPTGNRRTCLMWGGWVPRKLDWLRNWLCVGFARLPSPSFGKPPYSEKGTF